MLTNKAIYHNRQLTPFILIGVLTILLGISGVFGWLLNIEILKSVFPHYSTMKFNTAVCLILAGAAFILLITYNKLILKVVFFAVTICLGVIAIISFSEGLFNYNANIDQVFFIDYVSIAKGLTFPGRMAQSTAICFSLIAIGLLGVRSKSITYKKVAQYLLHFVTLIAFIAIVGYLLKVPYTLKFSFFSSMAIHTAMAILLLSAAAAAVNSNLGVTSLFTGTGIGNIIARKLFPRMIIILILTGYISIELQRKNYISAEFGVIISTLTFLLIGLFLIRGTLTEMNLLDLKRTEAENETQQLNKNLEAIVLGRTLALKQSNERFLKIFNANPTGVTLSKADTGEYTDANPAILKMLGYEYAEMIGHRSSDLMTITPEFRVRMIESINEHGYISGEDVTLQSKDGMLKHCIFSAELIEDADEMYIMSFIYDITDRKIIENNLQDAKDKLEVLTDKLTSQNKQLLSFAHIISHNLRSPVSNLNLLMHFYKESESQEDKDDLWGNFETVINHLNTTLDELLETLKIQEDTAKEREELSFEKTFNAVKDILVGQIMESKAIITADFSKAPTVFYPKIYLESIFMNLISNAIKYKSPKRVPEINLASEIINGETVFTIEDNGLGIDLQRHSKNLFGLRKTFHRHSEAKGLGLFITKIQIDAMGGEIIADSEVDKGTKFTIIFNKG